MANLLFYALSAVCVLAAVGVIVARNPVISITSLLASFFSVALIYLLAGFQFLATVQILVYVGAIMVLFLFVVMLLNLGDSSEIDTDEPMFHQGRRAILAGATAAAILVASLIAILRADLPATRIQVPEDGYDPAHALAAEMFTRYSLPFEAASVLLLATAVGVLVLAKRQRRSGAAPGAGSEGGQ